MADNVLKPSKKGILKSSSSFEKPEPYRCNAKEMKWDEMNILQTLHPPDKDYGHMKIEEPKTPFSHYKDPEGDGVGGLREVVEPQSDDEPDGLDADLLAKKIQLGSENLPKALIEDEEEDDEDFVCETEEDRENKKVFEQKRKLHYNEFYAVKLARKLMEQETDEDDDEEEEDDKSKSPDAAKNGTEDCGGSVEHKDSVDSAKLSLESKGLDDVTGD